MAVLLMAGGAMNSVWATNVTYHILTLPIDPTVYDYHMKPGITGWRLEAVKVVANNQSTLELPMQYKSPLATGFTYYAVSDVTKYAGGTAQNLFDNGPIKGVLYMINGEDTETPDDDPTPVSEGTILSGSTAEYYVVYTYNTSNSIAKLDGSVRYNIRTKYKDNKIWKDKGFFALNRGRNNRPALLPTANVDPEMLASEDFMKASVDGTSVSPYWKDGNNKNKEADVASQFYFMFKFEGLDPYNIIIRTTYAKDSTYIEKNDGTNNFVYKWYKEGSLFTVSSGNNFYIASDEHRLYNIIYNTSTYPTNPTNLVEGAGLGYISRTGNYHGQTGVVWNSFTLLNNSDNNGYVFMGTRTVDGNGAINSQYYLKEKDNRNNLTFNTGNSTDNLSIEGIYPIEKVTFKVATPFYDPESPLDHIISVPDWVSQYTVQNDPIETKYLPKALKRKYCKFNGNFYKDAACTIPITHFSQAEKDADEGYQVYVGYDVSTSASAPKFLSPSASYTTATWYELTDEGSVQESGRKIKWDATNEVYKNNGANGEYEKESEFALVGDPYELKVLYRKGTEDAEENRYVTLSTFYTWDIPDDETDGSFLLRKYNATGYWSWDAGQASVAVTYGSDESTSVDKDAHTVTINLTGLNGGKYYKITTDGTGASQIVSVTPEVDNVTKETGTTLTVVVSLAANTSNDAQEMTVTIQEYNDAEGNTPSESPANPSVITITQTTASSSFAGNTVTYSTTNFTRVKVLDLPTRTYTYNIVDKSGRIAVKASTKQTIFSALSLASVPSIIVSPLIMDETVTFYDTYTDGSGRATLAGHEITETPDAAAQIYVKYTTTNLKDKPVNISENQEFNVVLNGRYLWFDSSDNSVKTTEAPASAELKSNKYLWKLRNLDPYAMLVDNLGAREDPDYNVANQTEQVTVYNDDGVSVKDDGTPATLDPDTRPERQKGAWVDLASIVNEGVISFTTVRADAQQFVAKASLQTGVYEVMVATGASVDASTTYYNIGRPAENTVKIYSNDIEHGGYVHGNDVLKFHLEQSTPYTYYLIDRAKHKLLTVTSQNPDLALPADYQSPLVATYKYYAANNISIDNKGTPSKSDDEYTPIDSTVMLSALSDLEVAYTGPTSSNATEWGSKAEQYKKTATDETNMLTQVRLLETAEEYVFRLGENEPYDYQKVNVTRGYRGRAIYVTYLRSSSIPFGTSNPYTLKFLEPLAEGYHLEDGSDKLTTGKIKAVYPYCNGDGNLNIYGEEMKSEQFGGGASTRPRWIWYFDSENNDPYHVRIRSRSTISYNSISHPTYLTTYAIHFNQDTGDDADKLRIVTGGTLPGVASIEPTEYMIVGSEGAYKLMTTDSIDDGLTKERRKVTSLEQYWKTYNMVKLDVLGISATTDAYSDDASTWEVPVGKWADLETALDAKGVGTGKWHSYDAYANATRWNGYNDKTDGHEKKVVEKLEHWFQTFDMGNGTFDIESADIPPVLVLLDLHGWEIMRLPLPTANYPEGEDELAALRAYDSPLVDKYYFYSNATKASGCHKYTLRRQDGKERDQIKVNGEHYSSSSLGDLPPRTASGVISGGAFNDQFVTYTVKEEYAKSYTYNLELNEGASTYTESGNASKFLVLLRSRFLRDNEAPATPSYNSKPIYEASNPVGGNVYDAILDPQQNTVSQTSTNVDDNHDGKIDNINLWYLQPNLDIDKEMGIKWSTSNDTTKAEPLSEFGTKKKYQNKTGFDPYNIQLKNAHNSKFLTSHQTSATLHDGILIGDYSGSGGTTDVTLATQFSYAGVDPLVSTGSEGYDHTNLKISNQTFMAVSDANGNMQLMPRFDHTKRVNLVNNSDKSHTTLQAPVDYPKASATDNSSMGTQTIFFVRPQVFEYHIIDNDGNESLRYKRSGDYYPAITDHFKSPIATNFTYYKGLAEFEYPDPELHPGDPIAGSNVGEWSTATGEYKKSVTSEALMRTLINLLPTAGNYYYQIGTRGRFTYKKVKVTKGLLEQQITGSFAEAGLNGEDCEVKVRYDYDANHDLDGDKILQGKWLTAKLANKDLQAVGEVMKYIRLVSDETAYTAAKNALSSDGVYYFRIGAGTLESPYSYKKVTRSGGSTDDGVAILEPAWTEALNLAGLGVDLYAGETSSLSLIASDADDVDAQAKKLTATGDYYFKQKNAENYWFVNVTIAYNGLVNATYTKTAGSYATKWSNSKPLVVDENDKKWQWKFVAALADPTSDYYEVPDPYAVHIYNRQANYTNNPSLEPSPMNTGIKVPNTASGADRFALLSHSEGGYALAKAGRGDYTYEFVNGAVMTTPDAAEPVAATTVTTETSFTQKAGIFDGVGSQLLVNDDVEHNFTYKVINNGGADYIVENPGTLAVEATQDNEEAESHSFFPRLPESAQTPLLREKDYKYYGFAIPTGPNTYKIISQTILHTLYGLYDDVVYVRYDKYNMDSTEFKIPNRKTTVDSHVARDPSSVDVSMNIEGELPYNIIWYDDEMMKAVDTSLPTDGTYDGIDKATGHNLSGSVEYVWYFTGNDPYALKIKHKDGEYVDGDATLTDAAGAKQFMLLKKSGYDYGILQETGGDNRFTYGDHDGNNETPKTFYMDDGDPTKFIVFGLSIHDLIYRLVIAKTCTKEEETDPELESSKYMDIPYRAAESGALTNLRIFGSTQRDLESRKDDNPANLEGSKYQLGVTLNWYDTVRTEVVGHTYCYDAGAVSIGDELTVPNIFNRPNCTFEFYIEGIYQHYAEDNANEGLPYQELNNKYKGLKLDKLMADEKLINQDVVVNVVYSFDKTLATNTGLDFVRDVKQNLWYTYETQSGETPYLAHYTNAWGMQSMEGRETRYTNDYLWTPLGDVYGFKMYNRYMIKNSGADNKVMTYAETAGEGKKLVVAEPGTTVDAKTYTTGNEIFELLKGDADGYFRVHPVVNNTGTQYYVRRYDDTDTPDFDGGGSDLDYTILSTTPCDWMFGLDMALLEPYYVRAGYVGGLTTTAKNPGVQTKSGKTLYEEALEGEPFKVTDLQAVVYNDDNIVDFSKGYYRLHSVPGTPGISPVRYASGYLHEIERDQNDDDDESDAIPMHFYSKEGVTGTFNGEVNPLRSGFTETHATRGDIPVPATEDDPSTIFYLDGDKDPLDPADGVNPRVYMSTQGLYVKGNSADDDHGNVVMTASKGSATEFSLIDIGGAVLLITNELAPATRKYIHYGQDAPMYDLKYYHNSPTNEARWCIEPANNKGLTIATNNGGDGYYYATFYAPYDVLLPNDVEADPGEGITAKTYNAYVCNHWHSEGVNPVAVPAATINAVAYPEGKVVPAGTPVIIRTDDESGSVTMTLPSAEPSTPISSCVFTGQYLEQLLPLDGGNSWTHDVYTLGLSMISDVKKDVEDYDETGDITAPLPEFATSGVGFYINATPNKEHNASQSLWLRNNRYVLHNKAYYRAESGSLAPERNNVLFVPVLFDDGEEEQPQEEPQPKPTVVGDGCVYDILGRKVASAAEVSAGTWRQRLNPGIYILNGEKIYVSF